MRPDRLALAPTAALLAVLAVLAVAALPSQQPAPLAPPAATRAIDGGPVPLVFLANSGQWPADATFVMRHRTFAAQFRRDGIQLQRERREPTPLGVALLLSFVGTDGVAPVVAEAAPTHVHSFTGDASRTTQLQAATALRYRDLWPGIDLVVHDCGGELEYDVELAPGADLAAVAFRCEGGTATIDAEGCLVVQTELGDLRQLPPRTWETGEEGESFPVPCRFALRTDGSYGFDVERCDPARKLVVDPVILWATYFGASGDDLANAIDVFPNGEVVVCGQTSSLPTFPTTPGTYQPAHAGGLYDGFIARIDPSIGGQAQLKWCTFYGGNNDDVVYSAKIGPAGEIAFVGRTLSTNLPTTPGALRSFLSASGDAFVGALSGDGTTLLYSTYLGGNGDDVLQRLEVEPNGWIDVVGYTTGNGMPVSAGAFQTTHQGGTYDGYVARLDRSLIGNAQLRWGTYVGTAVDNILYNLAVSPSLPGLITCVGYTNNDAPFSATQFGSNINGLNALIVQFDPLATGSTQKRMSCIVTTGANDVGYGIAAESNGDLVIAGRTEGANTFPTTVGAFRTTNVSLDLFITKITAAGTAIRYSTLLGASNSGDSNDMAGFNLDVNAQGIVTLAGYTNWFLPTTSGAIRSTLSGYDGFVNRFDASLSQMLYGTFIGGGNEDIITLGGAHFAGDVVTLCMRTRSAALPIQNPYQPGFQQGTRDGYLMRFDIASDPGSPGAPAYRTAIQPVGAGPHGVLLHDVDLDGDRDIVTANLTSHDLSLMRNDGIGGFATAAQSIALGGGNQGPMAVAAGDFDGDGQQDDLAAVCSGSNTVAVVMNAASTPTPQSLASGGQRPVHLAAGSLDGNATTDLVIAHEGTLLAGGAGLAIRLDGGATTAVAIPLGRAASLTRVGIADLDGDGDRDVVAVGHGATDEVLLFDNNGTGALTFAGFLPMTSTLSLGTGLGLVDLDGDNDIDIAVIQPLLLPSASQTLRFYRYVGSGPLDAGDYAVATDVPSAGIVATALACADLDGDRVPGFAGGTDIVVVNADGSVRGHYAYSATSGAFAATATLTSGAGPADVAMADLDGDGTNDVVIANQASSTVTIHRTDGAFVRPFGTGCTSIGHAVPAISATTPPRIGLPFTVNLQGALPSAAALLAFAGGTQNLPLGSGCTLYLDLSFTTTLHLCDTAGSATDVQSLPNAPSLVGLHGFFQWAALDPQGPFQGTLSFSNALWAQVGN